MFNYCTWDKEEGDPLQEGNSLGEDRLAVDRWTEGSSAEGNQVGVTMVAAAGSSCKTGSSLG